MNTAETLVSTNINQSVFFHMKIIDTILQMCKFCHRTSVGQTNDLYLLSVNQQHSSLSLVVASVYLVTGKICTVQINTVAKEYLTQQWL